MMRIQLLLLASLGLALAVVSSPVFAVPSISVTRGGTFANNYLDANGNWVWNIQISNSDPVPTGSSPLAAELGFTAINSGFPVSVLIGASNLSTGQNDDFDTNIPSAPIFGWEQPGSSGFPEGLQTNCESGCTVTGSADQVFSALKSVDYNTVGPHDYVQIITRGPANVRSKTSTLTVSGAYNGNGRIAEDNPDGMPPTINHDIFMNVFTRTAAGGDANLDGLVDDGDLNLLLSNFNGTGKHWYDGDFSGEGSADDGDLTFLLTNFGRDGPIDSGAGAVIVRLVPEPAALPLFGAAIVGLIGFFHRRATV